MLVHLGGKAGEGARGCVATVVGASKREHVDGEGKSQPSELRLGRTGVKKLCGECECGESLLITLRRVGNATQLSGEGLVKGWWGKCHLESGVGNCELKSW